MEDQTGMRAVEDRKVTVVEQVCRFVAVVEVEQEVLVEQPTHQYRVSEAPE